ncbi:hypothetical protein PG996_008707 [Apiospora saccharicola]|uniref:Secreted protein n=1 Tax=Apiospora saccharicola TaxID=335842 RepID=A0ABR1V186_9PEZI
MWTWSETDKIAFGIVLLLVSLVVFATVLRMRRNYRNREILVTVHNPSRVPLAVRRRRRNNNTTWSSFRQQQTRAATAAEPTRPQPARLPERPHAGGQGRAAWFTSVLGGNRHRTNAEPDLEEQELDTLPPYSPPQYSQSTQPEQPPRKN